MNEIVWIRVADEVGLPQGSVTAWILCGVAVLGVVLWLARALRRRRPSRVAPRPCRWEKGAARGRLRGWTCRACGVEAWSASAGPPEQCKRAFRSAPL